MPSPLSNDLEYTGICVFKAFLDEKEVETLDLAARLADDYSLTHKTSFVNKPFPRKPFNPQSKFTPQSRPFSPSVKTIFLSVRSKIQSL